MASEIWTIGFKIVFTTIIKVFLLQEDFCLHNLTYYINPRQK